MTFQYIYVRTITNFLKLLDDEQDIVGQLNDALALINNLHPTKKNLNGFQREPYQQPKWLYGTIPDSFLIKFKDLGGEMSNHVWRFYWEKHIGNLVHSSIFDKSIQIQEKGSS